MHQYEVRFMPLKECGEDCRFYEKEDEFNASCYSPYLECCNGIRILDKFAKTGYFPEFCPLEKKIITCVCEDCNG